jgi:phage terminase small subunit
MDNEGINFDDLTQKQRIFCHEYVVDWNASRAARVAGYSEHTAHSIGHENLSKPEIKAYIKYIQIDLARLAGVSKLRNLQELSKIAYSSIAHLHNTWIERKEFEELTDDQKAAIESIDTKTETNLSGDELIRVNYVKIKLFSKTTAIEMMNKMMGYNDPEKHEITKIELSPEEKRRKIAELREKLKD